MLQRLGAAIHAAGTTADEEGEPALDPVIMRELDSHVQRLTAVLGGSERILRTPLPTSYTRHTSRFLFIWLHSMPLVLYPTTGLGTLPASLFIAVSEPGLLGTLRCSPWCALCLYDVPYRESKRRFSGRCWRLRTRV